MAEYILCTGFGRKNNIVAVYHNFMRIGEVILNEGKTEFKEGRYFQFSKPEIQKLIFHGKQCLHFLNSGDKSSFSHIIRTMGSKSVVLKGECISNKPLVSIKLENQDR